MRDKISNLCILIGVACWISFLSNCDSSDPYYLVGDNSQRSELTDLLQGQLEDRQDLQSVANLQIAQQLVLADLLPRMRVFLTTHVVNNPDDPRNAYWLFLVASSYKESAPATRYYRRIVWNTDDVELDNVSIHFMAIQKLIVIDSDISLIPSYYQELLDRFSDRISVTETLYRLAQSYETVREWEAAYDAYSDFLAACEQRRNRCQDSVDGRANLYETIQAQTRFYYSNKNWTVENLESLVASIKIALANRSITRLLRSQAKTNFFSRSWTQDEFDFNSQINFDIGTFLSRSNVRFADTIDINSNEQEAYLRTWGWSHRIDTWYLYFRRIDFPSDPDIHRNWEWGGIFFGERL